jgi:hypothetical protein
VPSPDRTLLALNHVRAGREHEFEEWLRSVLVPAARSHQPHLEGRWHILRGEEPDENGTVFAFVFDEGTDDDWDLRALLVKALGTQRADEELSRMGELLAQDQYGWWLSPVDLGRA